MGYVENKGLTIKKIRLYNGITQEQMAKRLHITQSNISRWEKGEVEPTDLTMAKIQKKFKSPPGTYDYINNTVPGQVSMLD